MGELLAIKGGKRTVPEGLAVKWPVITEEHRKLVNEVLDSGVLCGAYAPQVKALEREFREYIGADYCLAMNSGTAALHAAISAAGIGPGDEVITSAFTFLASALAVLQHNAIPRFVDIDPKTYNIDPKKIEEKINEKTKAIMPVHIHGLPADMDEIMAIAKKYGLVVIEDACQAHGAEYKGRKAGTIGDMGTFSLNTTKNMPGGEGGLFITDSKELYIKANMFRMFGEDIEDPSEGKFSIHNPYEDTREYNAYILGWNYRSQELPAAFARGALKNLDLWNANARRNAEFLTRELSKIKGVIPPTCPPDRTHIYHKYRVRLDTKALGVDMEPAKFRDKVRAALQAEGVAAVLWQTRVLPKQTLFERMEGYGRGCPWTCPHARQARDYREEEFPETQRLLDDSIVICSQSYPIFPQKLELMEYYVEAFHKVFDNLDQVVS
ncbi:MAG TPA: DegT/DnrJ/EryC1/StrS family aminotransferase [Firmicutes bacterium]|nr:DegT/DnrJ/EryC1/StrS family aminotransferase [Bacillota bacterium]